MTNVTYVKGVKLMFKRKHRQPVYGVTINGVVIHKATGKPVKAGELVAGKSYTIDLTGLLKPRESK